MRIRKRLPPPPPPPVVSDPQLRRSEAAPPSDRPSYPPKQPPGESGSIRPAGDKWVFSNDYESDGDHSTKLKDVGDDETWIMKMKTTYDDIRKIVKYISSGEESGDRIVLHPSTTCAQENKMVQKHGGSFESPPPKGQEILIPISNMKSKTKTITVEENKNKNKRGKMLMEGSRCSRINGRGWRCRQPTLVGYSLCEHHLGKGRLRSRLGGGGGGFPVPEEEEEPTLMVTKKRTKVGVVKARSMSSLLSQI